MSVVPRSGVYGFGRVPSVAFLGGIVTPGTSTYPSQDGTFSIVRGTGAHNGNGLIDGRWIVAGVQADGYYALDDNNTGSIVDDNTVGRKYKVGAEYQTFIDATPTSPEYIDFQKQQRAIDEANNPKLKAYDDALRAWAISQTPPVSIDPVYGLATNFDMATAPLAVQQAYADFTGHPIPAAPAPAPQPAQYFIAGIRFGDDGTVYDSTGHPTGETLSPDEVHSLLSTGSMPVASPPVSPKPLVPSMAPATTAPASVPPTTNVSTSPAPTSGMTPTDGGGVLATRATITAPSGSAPDVGTFANANPTLSLPAPQPPVGTTTGDPATTPPLEAGIGGALSAVPWWGWAVVGGLVLLTSRRRA